MTRETGRTTRAINEAVEKLFTKGVIIIPFTKTAIDKAREYNTDTLCVDPDWPANPRIVQRVLAQK